MNWLNFMTRTDVSRALYLWRAYLVVVVGGVLLAVLAVLIFPQPETASEEGGAPPLLGFVIVWPVASTLVLWGALEVLRRVTPTYWHAAGAAALVFAGLFTLPAGLQGGMIFIWPYFIYALTFLAWQLRSNLEGFLMAAVLQAGVNLTLKLFVFPPAA